MDNMLAELDGRLRVELCRISDELVFWYEIPPVHKFRMSRVAALQLRTCLNLWLPGTEQREDIGVERLRGFREGVLAVVGRGDS